jgi:anti-sigma B factor antagonist
MLEINKSSDQDHIMIGLIGEVDASNSVELDDAIKEAMCSSQKKNC